MELRAELNFSSRSSGENPHVVWCAFGNAGSASEVGKATLRSATGRCKVHPVEEVEGLDSDFQTFCFGEFKVLRQGEINVNTVRSPKDIPARIAVGVGSASPKGAGIVPRCPGGSETRRPGRSHLLCKLPPDTRIGVIERQRHTKGTAAISSQDAAQLPITKDGIGRSRHGTGKLLTLAEGQVVDGTERQDVGVI